MSTLHDHSATRKPHEALVALRGVVDACQAFRPGGRRASPHGEASVTLELLPRVVGIFADCLARRPGALARVRGRRELPSRAECGVNHPGHVGAWMALRVAARAVLALEGERPEAEAIAYSLDIYRTILESDLHFCAAVVKHHLREDDDDADANDLIDLGALADAARPRPAA